MARVKASRKLDPDAPDPIAEQFAANRKQHTAMAKIAGRFGNWKPAAEVIRRVQAVPTIFAQYDYRLGVGGHPLGRIVLVHGPSNHGKSEFALGLGLSFLKRDHFFGFVDAERTTPMPWVSTLMRGVERHPGFVALPVGSYEKTVGSVRQFCETIAEAREAKEVSEQTTGIVVVDSIRKLVPEGLLKQVLKELKSDDDEKPTRGRRGTQKKKGIDGAGGRGAQIKAALNSAWMDDLVPLLAETNATIVIIARETDDPDAGPYDQGWKVGGGKALFYDASVDVRVSRSWVYVESGDEKKVVGERHKLDIHKTKISGKVERVPAAYYHTSNGTIAPEGYDAPRDVLEFCEDAGLVSKTGNWFAWGKQRIGNGRESAIKRLHSDPELFRKLEADARAFIAESTKSVASSDP